MATVFYQDEAAEPENGSRDDDRRVIIIERDSGLGWAVAFIVLAIAIGFGIIMFMDQQSMIEYKIERALQKIQDGSNVSVKAGGQQGSAAPYALSPMDGYGVRKSALNANRSFQ